MSSNQESPGPAFFIFFILSEFHQSNVYFKIYSNVYLFS